MARFNFCGLLVLAIAVSVVIVPAGWSEDKQTTKPATGFPPTSPPLGWTQPGLEIQRPSTTTNFPTGTGHAPAHEKEATKPAAESGVSCKVYSLSDFGNDPNIGKWIAETIPEVIQPGTWAHEGAQAKHVLRYYGPGKVLVVYHTPGVHAQVAAFLSSLKKAIPAERHGGQTAAIPGRTVGTLIPAGAVVPAKHTEPQLVTPAAPAAGYPVPAAKQPKHLFHFIIRYEGDGIIDTNVADLLKALYGASKENGASQENGASKESNSSKPDAPKGSTSGTTLTPSNTAPQPSGSAPVEALPPGQPASNAPPLPQSLPSPKKTVS
jgi:hypothetical protein